MNAKKIMGAVLVALLAAALFVGAGAAAGNLGTVFVNQGLEGYDVEDYVWVDSTGATATLLQDPKNPNKYYFPKAGTYTATDGLYEASIVVVVPELSITGVAGSDIYAYPFIPGTLYTGTQDITITVWSQAVVADYPNVSLFLGYPNGDNKLITNASSSLSGVLDEIVKRISANDAALGEYSITAVFNPDLFVNGTKSNQFAAKPVTFTLAEADAEGTLSASVDQILKGNSVILTITGQPGEEYQVKFNEAGDFTVDVNQLGLYGTGAQIDGNGFNFTMPNAGEVAVVVISTANAEDSEKIELSVWSEGKWKKQASVTIKLSTGTITAKTDAASYFVGDVVKITGTSTAGDVNKTLLTLTGTNFVANDLTKAFGKYKKTGDAWSFELDTSMIKNDKVGSQGKMIDVGSYTLTLDTGSA